QQGCPAGHCNAPAIPGKLPVGSCRWLFRSSARVSWSRAASLHRDRSISMLHGTSEPPDVAGLPANPAQAILHRADASNTIKGGFLHRWPAFAVVQTHNPGICLTGEADSTLFQ